MKTAVKNSILFSTCLLIFSCTKQQKNEYQSPVATAVTTNMILIPGGEALIGNNNGFSGEMPAFTMHIDSFYLDISPVTVADFRKFVAATHYVTDAEKFGNSAVFNFRTDKWELWDSATWQYPQGPSFPGAIDDHPVTHVSYHDALAYCRYVHKRLPTEFEFEYAARNASESTDTYSWGNSLIEDHHYMANTWQGHFPDTNMVKDGYQLTAPVGSFGKTKLGLTDMGGNVWEWTGSWYQPYKNIIAGINDSSSNERTIRGGSFLCDTLFCHGYRVSARTSCTEESSLFHLGFRCALSK